MKKINTRATCVTHKTIKKSVFFLFDKNLDYCPNFKFTSKNLQWCPSKGKTVNVLKILAWKPFLGGRRLFCKIFKIRDVEIGFIKDQSLILENF